MNAQPTLHPTDQTLDSYGLGKLDDGSAEAVNKHLEECPECRKRVADMPADSFLGRVQDAQRPSGKATFGQSRPEGTPRAKAANTLSLPPSDKHPPVLADHPDYLVKRELGRGGMGVVYLAHNTLMGRDEVLKVMGRQIMERPGVLDRFVREIRAVAKLRHANIVTAYHATRLGESIIFAMEYVEGLDLYRMVKAKGPLPVVHACNFVYQAALGLQHAHEEGLVHRDIKPGNLMLSRKGDKATIKVLDFGLAKVSLEEKFDGALTSEGQAIGTPDFIAPEQILDAQSADIRSDIYSLGGTLYYLLTGRPPFQANSMYDVYQAHISQDASPLNLLRPEVPAELAALVAKMMAKDPARRFQTPAEVAQALTPFFKKGNAAFQSPTADVSQVGPSPMGQPVGNAVSTPIEPATNAGGSIIQAKKAIKTTSAKPRRESLIERPEAEGPSHPTAPATDARRHRPWWLWPVAAAAAGLAAILLGIIIVITIERNRVTIVVRPDNTRGKDASKPGGAPSVAVAAPARKKVELKPAEPKKVAETNPWPKALPLAGQKFSQVGRFLAMSRDCRRVAVLSSTGNVRVIDALDVGRVVEVKGQRRNNKGDLVYVWGADFSPDGKYIAGACNDPPDFIWNTSTGDLVRQLSGADYNSIACAYSLDGKHLAIAGRHHKVVHVWNTLTDEKPLVLRPHPGETLCVAFSPDGRRVASGGGANPGDGWSAQFGLGPDLRVWDMETQRCTVLEGHSMRLAGVTFSPDGQRLASASTDKTVKVWDLATSKCLVTFNKHHVVVLSVRFSPDGRLIASIGQENAVRVWDSATGREIDILWGLSGEPEFVHFSPGGRWIYAGARDTLKAWEAPTADRIQDVGSGVGRPLESAKSLDLGVPKASPAAPHSGNHGPPAKSIAGPNSGTSDSGKNQAQPAAVPDDMNRRAASAMLSLGGSVTIRVNGREQRIEPGKTLPTEALQLTHVQLGDRPELTNAELLPLAGLASLVDLRLSKAPKVTEAGVLRLGKLPRLEALWLDGTGVTDDGLMFLQGLPTLKELALRGTGVSDKGLRHVRGLSQLRLLALGGSRVTDAGLFHVQGLVQLERLWLEGTGVADAGLENLRGLTKLRELLLFGTHVTDAGLSNLQNLKDLELLWLSGTSVSDAGLEPLGRLTKPRSLWLDGTGVTDAGLERLKELTQLKELRLNRTAVTNDGLVYVERLTQLKEIHLHGTNVTAARAEELRKKIPACQVMTDAAGTTDFEKLQGNWVETFCELEGQEFRSDGQRTRWLLNIKGNRYIMTNHFGAVESPPFSLMPGRIPKAIDVHVVAGPDAGKINMGIYELDGDTLRTCWTVAGQRRPTEFTTKQGTGIGFQIWKRQR